MQNFKKFECAKVREIPNAGLDHLGFEFTLGVLCGSILLTVEIEKEEKRG